MSQLKPSFVNDILDTLGKSRFTKDDFKVELPKSGRVLVSITFVHKPEYSLILTEEQKQNQIVVKNSYDSSSRTESVKYTTYIVREVPGRYKIEDQSEIDNPGGLLDLIPKWCDNIRSDLYALAPQVDPLQEFRRKLDEDISTLIPEPCAFFTEEEMVRVDLQFDKLFAEISELREHYSLTKQQLDDIQREFEEFRKSARVYPKGMWARVTGNRYVNAAGQVINSPEGRNFLFQQIRRLLGGGDGA